MSRTLSTITVGILTLVALFGFAGTAVAQEEEQVRCDPFLNGIASLVVPGWGQWLNGEGSKAVVHVAVAVGLAGAAFLLAGTPASLLAALAGGVWNIYSAYDAFSTCIAKHEATKEKSLIPAGNT